MVHFVEWTTGWARKRQKAAKKAEKQGASGPLRRVDHWLLCEFYKQSKKQLALIASCFFYSFGAGYLTAFLTNFSRII